MDRLDLLRMAAAARLRLEVERYEELVLADGVSRLEALDRVVAERRATDAEGRRMRDELDEFERPREPRAP